MHYRYRWGLMGVFLLLVLSSYVKADWEEFTKPLYLDVSGNNYKGSDLVEVENYFIKLISLDYDSKFAEVVISDRAGVTYYEGPISETKDFLQQGKIWVRFGSLRISNGHPQVQFKVFLWQELSLEEFNIPRLMNWEDEYNVFMDWKNTGDASLDVVFQVTAQDGFVTPSKLDKTIHFEPWESKRVYFKLRPEKYVTTGPLTAARQNLEDLSLQLLIYSAQSGNLLRRVDMGLYSLTSGPTAFIEEIVTPLTQFTGKEYEVKIRVRNSGYPQKNTGNLIQDSFIVSLEAPGFTIRDSNKEYVRLDPLTTKEVSFTVKPESGGMRNIIASFNVDRKPAAMLAEKIAVKGTKTLLLGDLSNIPKEFLVGNNYKIPIKVLNKGDFTEEVVVRLSSDNFKFKNSETVLKLPPNSDQAMTFDALADKEGAASLLVEVITTSESFKVTQYFKSQGIAADEKTLAVMITGPTTEKMAQEEGTPEGSSPPKPNITPPTRIEEEPIIKGSEETPSLVAVTPKPVKQTSTEPEVAPNTTEPAQPSFSLVNAVLLIVGIIIVFVLIAMIVKMSTKKSSHKKKKKKQEGDFELE
ncbi:MAG: hypothetical protein AABX70_00780 [Nanoarchaeota archaeon]